MTQSFSLFSAESYSQKFERKAGDAGGLVAGEKVKAFAASVQKENIPHQPGTLQSSQPVKQHLLLSHCYRYH